MTPAIAPQTPETTTATTTITAHAAMANITVGWKMKPMLHLLEEALHAHGMDSAEALSYESTEDDEANRHPS